MKKNKLKEAFFEELRKVPIVQVACEKTGVSRNSVYRWRKEDEEFRQKMDVALSEGEDLINDLTETQLLTLIKEKNYQSISFWLRHRNPKFKQRIELEGNINTSVELSPELEELRRQALEYTLKEQHEHGI